MFLGRQREIAELNGALERSLAGHGGLALVGGDPGIGKTAIAVQITEQARAKGAQTFWGRCREEGGAPAHWPWVQVLRGLAQAIEPERLVCALGRGIGYVTHAVPELADRLPAAARALKASIAPERFAFFDAVETFLRKLAIEVPLLIVLDDLHAADASSLALLEYLVEELPRGRVFVVATYRHHEAEAGEAGPAVARIGRHAVRVRLRGLGVEDVGAIVEQIASSRVPDPVVRAIHSATDGSPLFVQELVRTLQDAGRLEAARDGLHFDLPDTLQHVIAMRLAPLSGPARETMSAASVMGRSFDVVTLAAATGAVSTDILEHLEQAVEAGVVSVSGGARGAGTFAHSLYREFFYGKLALPRRSLLHLRMAAALEEADAEADVSAIAHHLLEAGPLGDLKRAGEYAARAGRQAMERLAFAQAVGHYEAALHAVGRKDDRSRCELLLALGEACFRDGRGEAAAQAFAEAAKLGRITHDGRRLARAALGLAGPWPLTAGQVRDHVVDELEAALRELEANDDALRARLLARLAIESHWIDSPDRQRALTDEAVLLARGAGESRALADALLARHLYLNIPLGSDNTGERLALAREVVAIARETGDTELDFIGRFNTIYDLINAGEGHALDREIASAERLAHRLRQPFYFWFVAMWRAQRALIEGRLGEAERLVDRALEVGRSAQGAADTPVFAQQVYVSQLVGLRCELGTRLEEAEAMLAATVERVPHPLAQLYLAWIRCELERWGDARDVLEQFAKSDFAAVRSDSSWFFATTLLAELSVQLGDRRRAQPLYEMLRPYASYHSTNGMIYFGVIAHHLGRLAMLLGLEREAAAHFEFALEEHRGMGARCWLTRTQYHYAELLLASGDPQARQRGVAFLEQVIERARHLGMARVLAAAEKLKAASADVRRQPETIERPPEAADAGRNVFRQQGDYWMVSFGGQTFQMRDQKGLRYLRELLAHPGREVQALDLMIAVEGQADEAISRAEAAELGLRAAETRAPPTTDHRAVAAYRERLHELHDELEEARTQRDTGRRERLETEVEKLAAELKRAGSRGGRAGAVPAALERARLNVSRAIHATAERLGHHCPALEQHLTRTIHTGRSCRYDPGAASAIAWET